MTPEQSQELMRLHENAVTASVNYWAYPDCDPVNDSLQKAFYEAKDSFRDYLATLTQPHAGAAEGGEAAAKVGYETAKRYGCDICGDAVAAKVNAAIRALPSPPATGK